VSAAAQRPSAGEPWSALTPAERQALATIAQDVMYIQTLDTRHSDRLDFHDVAVWTIREALAKAFLRGRQRARQP